MGATDTARTLRYAADTLDGYERERALEALTLDDAARESGFSSAHLGRLVAEGRIENVGRKHAPRVRRADLPKKPNPPKPATITDGEPDLVSRNLYGEK